ncbi:hypothetical protein H2201_007490 [Coniosporium apollinis]|uniref:T6SS Phospholipase effector Tle1-like catalytic domain-containing protein n=2 Tax=Coniosporium TaxID=2810619 RepID=A0ABQ9NKQ4_9PEZI|nr:hypothetical protein H2199_002734 [Cladosporium sp. JES 115]KAJ9659088.1 hypothetical protein H2201_007490 [Coniosporium apollinis]
MAASSAHGINAVPSNVAKISRSFEKWYKDSDGTWELQMVYYDAGVADEGKGTFGYGLDENVCEAYNFLVNNYSPGDRLFFFGFSRGAYTTISASGSLEDTEWGKYPPPPGEEQFFDSPKDSDGKPLRFRKGGGHAWLTSCSKDVKTKIEDVWDTVGSLGYPDNAWKDVSGVTIQSYSLATAEILADTDKTKLNEKRKAGWGTGPFIDSYDGIEDTAAGEEDRRPGAYTKVRLTRECMHSAVEHLRQQGRGGGKFEPNVLAGFSRDVNGPHVEEDVPPRNFWFHQRVWNFVNRKVLCNGKEDLAVEIPEFVIPRVVSKTGSEDGPKLFQAERELIKYCSEGWKIGLTKEQQEKEEKIKRDDSALRFLEQLDAGNKNHARF